MVVQDEDEVPLLALTIPVNPDIETNLETAVEEAYENLLHPLTLNNVEDDDDDHTLDHETHHAWLSDQQRQRNKKKTWYSRPSPYMIVIVAFCLTFAGLGAELSRQVITYKLACNYLSKLSGSPDEHGNGTCSPQDTQILMSNLSLATSICLNITTLIASGKMGPLSDLYGRKICVVIIVGFVLAGRLLKFALMSHYDSLYFVPMVLCEVFMNLGGGGLALIGICNAYISDVVEPHQRSYSLGLAIAGLFLGASLGPVVGNLLIKSAKNTPKGVSLLSAAPPQGKYIEIEGYEFIPLKFELLVLAMLFAFTVFILPESRGEQSRRLSRSMSQTSLSLRNGLAGQLNLSDEVWWKRWIAHLNFVKPLSLLWVSKEVISIDKRSNYKNYRFPVLALVLIDAFLTSMSMGIQSIFVLYGIYQYHWSQTDLGHLLAVEGSARAIVLVILFPLINHHVFQGLFGFRVNKRGFDMIDFSFILFGLFCECVGLTLMKFAPTTLAFLVSSGIMSLGALAAPNINTAIIKHYPELKIGELFAAISLVKNLSGLIIPVIFITVYKWLLKNGDPGWLFVGIGVVLAFFMGLILLVKHKIEVTSQISLR